MRLLLLGLLAVPVRAQTRLVDLVPPAEAPAIPGAVSESIGAVPSEALPVLPQGDGRLEPLSQEPLPRMGLSEAAHASVKEGAQPLNALFDAQNRRGPAAVEVGEPAPKDEGDWAALDGLLSARMGIAASEDTTGRFRRNVILTLRSEPSLALETAIERGFSKAHSLVPAQDERLPKVLNNYDDFRKLDASWDEYKAEIEKVKDLTHPHPNRVYVIKTDRPVTLMAAQGAIWERSPHGYWKPVERRLEWVDLGQHNQLMMLPDRWAIKHIDRKGLHFFAVGENIDMGDGIVAKALSGGLWRFDLPLPEGWRSRLLRDAAAYHNEPSAKETPRGPMTSESDGIVGRGGRSIFSSFGGPGVQ